MAYRQRSAIAVGYDRSPSETTSSPVADVSLTGHRSIRDILDRFRTDYLDLPHSRGTSVRVAAILEEIHSSLFERGLNVKTLRARCRVSDHNVASVFKVEVGESVMTYITRLRIEAACMCLRSTTLSLAAIASATGFSSLQAFYKAFRAVHAMTPGDYRKKVSPLTQSRPFRRAGEMSIECRQSQDENTRSS